MNLWKEEIISFDYEGDNIDFSTQKITEFEAIWRGKSKKVCF
jgi:hypothetical protein